MALRIDGGVDGPPVPAQPVEAAGGGDAEVAEGERRLGAGGFRRIGGIAREPAHPHHPVVQVVIGLEGVIAEGPVLADAIQAAGPEIRGVPPGEMRRPVDRRAAHPVPHQGLQRRAGIIDGIVGGKGIAAGFEAQIGRRGPGTHGRALPLPAPGRHGGAIDPPAALEAEDAKPRCLLGQPGREGAAREARAHHGHIHRFAAQPLGHAPSLSRSLPLDAYRLRLSQAESGGPPPGGAVPFERKTISTRQTYFLVSPAGAPDNSSCA